jgi:hypothetical protein
MERRKVITSLCAVLGGTAAAKTAQREISKNSSRSEVSEYACAVSEPTRGSSIEPRQKSASSLEQPK